jgi:hypothetical protein
MSADRKNMIVGNVPDGLRRKFVGTCHILGVPAREILIKLMEQWLELPRNICKPTPPVAPLIRKLTRGA